MKGLYWGGLLSEGCLRLKFALKGYFREGLFLGRFIIGILRYNKSRPNKTKQRTEHNIDALALLPFMDSI